MLGGSGGSGSRWGGEGGSGSKWGCGVDLGVGGEVGWIWE